MPSPRDRVTWVSLRPEVPLEHGREDRASQLPPKATQLNRIPSLRTTPAFTLLLLPLALDAQDVTTLPTLYVNARRTANSRPVATYQTPVSGLEFEPRIDLQSRNMAEAQGDVTIRGGIFENTGFRIGSANLMDPANRSLCRGASNRP